MSSKLTSLPDDSLHIVRGVPVILAAKLAGVYKTTTKAVNQYRSRNEDRFTSDFAFQLTKEVWGKLEVTKYDLKERAWRDARFTLSLVPEPIRREGV